MKLAGRVFTVLISLLLFMQYPLALISPYGVSWLPDTFYFEYPHIFTASVISLCYLFLKFEEIDFNSAMVKLLGAAFFILCISTVRSGSTYFNLIETSSFILVPLACSIALRDDVNKKILVCSVCVLFSLSLIFSLFLGKSHLFPGFGNRIGISGNQNWYSATLLGSLPFVLAAAHKYFSRKYFIAFTGIISVLVLWKLWQAETRSVIPALAFCGFIFLWNYFSFKKAALYAGVVVIAGGVLVLIKIESVQRGLNRDIRLPLTKDTISMTLDAPLTGHGPGFFQKHFPKFASDDLKRKEVFTPVQEHPHNQFLLLSSTGGLVTAMCWLILMFFIFKKRDHRSEIAALFSIAVLFTMGLSEKILSESPSAMVFLAAVGLALSELIPGRAKEEKLSSKSKYTLSAAAGLILIFSGLVLSRKIPSEWYAYKGEVYKRTFLNNPVQKNLVKVMDAFAKSSDTDPSNVESAYAAASIGLQYYKDFNIGRTYLERLLEIEPEFADTYYKKALYYEKLGAILGEEDRKEYMKEAEISLYKNFEMSPYNIDRAVKGAMFFARHNNYGKCYEWINRSLKVVRQKVKVRYGETSHFTLETDVQRWKEKALNNQIEHPFKKYSAAYNRPVDLRYDYSNDYLFRDYFSDTKLNVYPLSNYGDLDLKFWNESLILHSKAQSLQDVFDLLLNIKVDNSQLAFPLQTLEGGRGNALAVASLACALNNLLGNRSAILQDGTEVTALLFDKDGSSFFWNCRTGVKIETSVEAFHQSEKIQKQLSMEAEKASYALFAYPQAFCLKNQVLSSIVSMVEGIPDFSVSPSLQYIELRQILRGRPVGLLTEFRALLEKELTGTR